MSANKERLEWRMSAATVAPGLRFSRSRLNEQERRLNLYPEEESSATGLMREFGPDRFRIDGARTVRDQEVGFDRLQRLARRLRFD